MTDWFVFCKIARVEYRKVQKNNLDFSGDQPLDPFRAGRPNGSLEKSHRETPAQTSDYMNYCDTTNIKYCMEENPYLWIYKTLAKANANNPWL